MRAFIYPYKKGSRSAKALAQAVGGKQIKLEGSRYQPRNTHLIVNWGNSKGPQDWGGGYSRWLNPVMSVVVAANKLAAFRALQEAGVPIPEFTTDVQVALGWGCDFMARTKLTGHSGDGCHFIKHNAPDGEEQYLPMDAPLYVKYIKKKEEYRVHICLGEVIDIQQKKKRNGVEDANFQIRSHANGWVFARDGINPDDSIREHAIAAVTALGLDFGAVDIIWNAHQGQAYVLEVNTAPGLEGSTINAYANKIKELL